MALVGFKRMTIRVLDGNATPTLGQNLFVIEGKTGEGATRTAVISIFTFPTPRFETW